MNGSCDVAVLGASPAGLCVAIRLLQMGRTVTILERAAPAHGNVGELLTPGVRGILDFLGLPDAMQDARGQDVISSRVIWPEQHAAVSRPPFQQAGIMVDRALFDRRLLRAALDSGANVLLSTVASMVRHPEGWRIGIDNSGDRQLIAAHFVVDARGRNGSANGRVPLTPHLLAICCEFPAHKKECEVSVEALEDGWLWGAPTSRGFYRVLVFGDPAATRQKQTGHALTRLQGMLGRSRLFQHLATLQASRFAAYNATSFLHRDWWDKDILKVGDAALALDPLSSSGVEKSMRLALQAALAINTILTKENASPLARQFMEAKVFESCGRHMAWMQEQYATAWCAREAPFWRERAAEQSLKGLPEFAALRVADARTTALSAVEIDKLVHRSIKSFT